VARSNTTYMVQLSKSISYQYHSTYLATVYAILQVTRLELDRSTWNLQDLRSGPALGAYSLQAWSSSRGGALPLRTGCRFVAMELSEPRRETPRRAHAPLPPLTHNLTHASSSPCRSPSTCLQHRAVGRRNSHVPSPTTSRSLSQVPTDPPPAAVQRE
jgi:hypothetical protein